LREIASGDRIQDSVTICRHIRQVGQLRPDIGVGLSQIGDEQTELLVALDDLVEDVGDVAGHARPIEGQTHPKVPGADAAQGSQELDLVYEFGS